MSPQQDSHAKKINFNDIVNELFMLQSTLTDALRTLERTLNEAKDKCKSEGEARIDPSRKPEPEAKPVSEANSDPQGKEKDKDQKIENELLTQLEKVCKEISYMIREVDKLEKFEGDLKKLLGTIESNVKDIQKDLEQYSSQLSEKLLEHNLHNLKVLRSNLTKVKLQIPLQHQASNLISDASRYLQATVPSREASDLPDLHEAVNSLDKSSFLEEILDKYNAWDQGDDIVLKLCLLCFAIFPENAEVKKSLLRFWWIGERLTERPDKKGEGSPGPEKKGEGSPGPEKEYEETDRVNEILAQLVNVGFINPVKKKSSLDATSYKMHPLVRAKLIRFAKEANFFDYDFKGNPIMDSSLVQTHYSSVESAYEYTKKTCLVKVPKGLETKGQVPQPNVSADQQMKLEKRLGKLQTVFNISKQFPDLPVHLFSKMNGLGVLHLGRWESTIERHMEVENTDFLKKGLVNMKNLRYFSLQGISGIAKLPESICKAKNLRILDLRALHNLEELPGKMDSLKKLSYLDISECYLIDYMPPQLDLLSQLRVLKGFVISKDKRSCRLDSLTKLPKLIKLTINVNSDEFKIDELEGTLTKFNALKKLRISWGAGGNEMNNDSGKKGNENHQDKDFLARFTEKITEKIKWTKKSSVLEKDNGKQRHSEERTKGKTAARSINLEKLDLQCFPRAKPPSWLVPEKLAELKNLYIRGGIFGELQHSSGVWKVEYLRLKYLAEIKTSWNELLTQFPELKYLERIRCPGITLCPCNANGVWLKPNSSKN